MQKKKMKNKVYLLMCLMLMFSLLPIISGAGFDWSEYGNDFQPSHQAQYETPYAPFDEAIITLTETSAGQDQFAHPTQPIIDSFGDYDTNYVVIVDGNYLKFYDNNLNFYTETFVGLTSMGQIGAVDWNDDGDSEGIAGFWRENTTHIHFKVFELNHTTQLVNEVYDYNFSYPIGNGVSGVRCSGNECYTILYDDDGSGYHWSDFVINSTGYVSHLLYSNRSINQYPVIEPPSRWDYDSDGLWDYLVFSEDRVTVYDELGVVQANWTFNRGNGRDEYVRSAKLFNGDASPYWKVAVAYDVPYQAWSSLECGTYSCARIQILNIPDETIAFEDNCLVASSSSDNPRIQGFAIKDYNGDFYDDIWCASSRITSNQIGALEIFKGDGTSLYSSTALGGDYGAIYPDSSMTLARMDSDSSFDAIIYANGKLRIWSPALDSMIYSTGLTQTSGQGACVPSDLNWDGFLDVVCVDSSSIEQLTPDVTNLFPVISQVAYDPSTLVAVNQTLNAIISATDNEGDTLIFRHRCFDAENWSAEDGSNVKTCSYDSVGTYTLTVGVRDSWHSSFTTFAQSITVTTTGAVCDNDFICEAEQGETYLSCPNDCSSPEAEEVPDTTTATDGMAIPTKLVDTDDINQGLLPEIYYGTLAFMSSVLSPTIVLVFVIFFALIMLTIGMIVKKFAMKVGEMGR